MSCDFSYQSLVLSSKNLSEADEQLMKDLLILSQSWAGEIQGSIYKANSREDFLDRELFLVREALSQELVGYALGDFKVQTEETSYNSIGEIAFVLDEIYILPAYRRAGLGQALYAFVEDEVRTRADFIGLSAMSPDHQGLLKFYLDQLGFSFVYALLVKRF